MNNIHGLSGGGSAGRGGGGSGGSGGGGSSTPGCMDQIKSSWAGVPLFNKWITTTLTVLMLVGFFLPINAFIALIPGYLLTFQSEFTNFNQLTLLFIQFGEYLLEPTQ